MQPDRNGDHGVIRTVALTKRYAGIGAVEDLSLDIRAGEIYGFLGPNGSGKTTTMRMLLGSVKPTSGDIYLFGERFDRGMLSVRARIGLVPERHPQGSWSWMTGLDYLLLFADLFHVPGAKKRAEALLERVGLKDARNRRVTGYSLGMLQRLSIARALLHDPQLLILDEPTGGLDAIGLKEMRDLILEENRSGRTILVSSHLLSEMERICHRIGIIYKGRLLAEDATGALLSRFSTLEEAFITITKDNVERLAGKIR